MASFAHAAHPSWQVLVNQQAALPLALSHAALSGVLEMVADAWQQLRMAGVEPEQLLSAGLAALLHTAPAGTAVLLVSAVADELVALVATAGGMHLVLRWSAETTVAVLVRPDGAVVAVPAAPTAFVPPSPPAPPAFQLSPLTSSLHIRARTSTSSRWTVVVGSGALASVADVPTTEAALRRVGELTCAARHLPRLALVDSLAALQRQRRYSPNALQLLEGTRLLLQGVWGGGVAGEVGVGGGCRRPTPRAAADAVQASLNHLAATGGSSDCGPSGGRAVPTAVAALGAYGGHLHLLIAAVGGGCPAVSRFAADSTLLVRLTPDGELLVTHRAPCASSRQQLVVGHDMATLALRPEACAASSEWLLHCGVAGCMALPRRALLDVAVPSHGVPSVVLGTAKGAELLVPCPHPDLVLEAQAVLHAHGTPWRRGSM